MTALVTKHLPLVAGAPDGIKKLRALILELAVRGRLLPSARQPNSDVPVGWLQTKLGSILSFEYGDNLPAAKRSNTGEYPVYGSNGVVGTHNVSFVQHPCIVIGRKGSAGALNLCTSPGCCVTDVAYYCVPPQSMSLEYTFKLLHTLGLDNLGKGIKPGLNRNEAYALDVLVPPLSEQHRIVAKVDELMALCDRLEADQADAEAAHAQLVQALLDSLTQATDAADAADFRASWQRLSEHFHTLFTTEASIDALKQTVLQLAVMGRLETQVESDGTAADLLAAISTRRKSRAPLPPIECDASPPLPSRWCWVHIADLAHVGTGATPSRTNPGYFNPPEINWVTSGETSQAFVSATEQKVSPLALSETNLTVYPAGTLVVAMYGQGKTRGQVTELLIDACTNQACAAIQLVCDDIAHRRYVKYFFEKSYDELRSLAAGGAQPNLNLGKIKETVIPLPPLKEQHRIVAKVDELMALCDQLKGQLSEARQHHEQLAQVLVEQAIA